MLSCILNKSTANVIDMSMGHIVTRYGVPKTLICDQRAEFQSAEIHKLLINLGVTMKRTTQYHPKINGKIECFHRTLKDILGKLVNNQHSTWEDHLPEALLAYRISTSDATDNSPHFMLT